MSSGKLPLLRNGGSGGYRRIGAEGLTRRVKWCQDCPGGGVRQTSNAYYTQEQPRFPPPWGIPPREAAG